jgi:hypothetical protein
MDEGLAVIIEDDARRDIVEELGSVNAFSERLTALVERESTGRASVLERSEDGVRGGVLEIVSAASGLIASLSPIVIAWIKSRSLEVEERTETTKGGKVTHTIRVRRGTGR